MTSSDRSSPILLTHAAQLLTSHGDAGPRRRNAMRELGIIKDGAVLIAKGKIVAVGTTDELRRHELSRTAEEIDCRGKVVLPGFVDSHTHPVFAAPRLVDFEQRIAGANYEQIAQAGGGIRSSIQGVRQASREVLVEMVLKGFREMAAHGTATVEAKSGYGLSLDSEIKSLEAIHAAARQWPGTVASTLLGAHVVPPEYRQEPDEYVRIVCEGMIPAVAAGGLKPAKLNEERRNGTPEGVPLQKRQNDSAAKAASLRTMVPRTSEGVRPPTKLADFVDVFCERGAFTVEQTLQICRAAREHSLGVRLHVGQLTPVELAPLLEFHPASLDHLDCISDADIALLAGTDTVATLLPAANYFLGLDRFPPARKLIDAGVAVALATDYNPGTAPTTSMQFVLSAACTQMKMSPAEAIVAATYNGACALRLEGRKGSLEPGKDADVAIFDAEDYRELAYWVGMNRCTGAILNGTLVNQ